MLVINDYINQAVLRQAVPRTLPSALPISLLGRYLARHPLTTFLDPLLICCIVAALALLLLDGPWLLWLLLWVIFLWHVAVTLWRVGSHVWESFVLLREGKIVLARVLRLRIMPDPDGTGEGAYVDCAIPTARRRTSLGSIWLPDIDAARQLKDRGSVPVLCLVRAPGTWVLLHHAHPDMRYGPLPEHMQVVPLDD